MKSGRYLLIFGALTSAFGLLVMLFASLSPVAAADEQAIFDKNISSATASDKWRILEDMRFGVGDPGVVALQNKVHVISGFYTPGYGNSSDQGIYDPETNTWQYLWQVFPKPRSNMVTANVNDKLYTMGGWNSDLQTVYSYTHMFDPSQSEWITMTSMITPVSGAGGVVISDSIYVIGGFDGASSIPDVQIYDTTNDTWSTGTPLPQGRSELGAVVHDGLIYAIGGNAMTGDPNPSTDWFEIYNPISGTWTAGPPLPEKRAAMAVAVVKGKIYAIGGTDNWAVGKAVDTTFVYDPLTEKWSQVASMPTARATNAAVISDTIYVTGGAGVDAGTANEAYGEFDILPTTTRITADDPDPSPVFQPLSVSYVVTSSFDNPTGYVTVTSGSDGPSCSSQLVNGAGSCEITFDKLGTYSLVADYGGDEFHFSSSDSESHEVVKAETTTSLIGDDSDPSQAFQPIVVNYQVSSAFEVPTGVVTVTSGTAGPSCSSQLVNGEGNCEIVFETLGNYTLTATYGGDEFHFSSSDIESHEVVKAETTTNLTDVVPSTSIEGEPISITFGVSAAYGAPEGTVTVMASNSSQNCSSQLVNGTGSCSITLDNPGDYILTAEYAGNASFASSSDEQAHQVVADTKSLYLPVIQR